MGENFGFQKSTVRNQQMDIPTTTNNIILEKSKKLKRLAIVVICLELIIIIWMINSLFSTSRWSDMSALEYGLKFSSLLLALAVLFFQYIYRTTLPKNDSDVIPFKQEKYEKPTLLRILLAIQTIALLYGAYSTSAWVQLYSINLFELNGINAIFNLIIFFALHIAIIINITFLVNMAQISMLINNRDIEEITKTKLQKSYKHAAILCIVSIIFLLYRLIPKLPSILTDISYYISYAQPLLLTYLIEIALTILLLCFHLLIFQRKEIAKLYKWIAPVLAIDLYLSMGITEGGVRILLEFPVIVIPILLSIISQGLLLASIVRISTYTMLENRHTFLNEAVETLQQAFANDSLFTSVFGKVDDSKNEAARSYLRFSVDSCDRQGDIYTYKEEAFLGWIMGTFFPPNLHDDSLLKYKEIALIEKHEKTPEKIIADNALDFAYLWILGTTPKARGKGLAKILIEKALYQMEKANIRECWLNAECNNNIEYYKKFGFELFAEQVSEFGVTTYVMVNKLNNRIVNA